jgi:hypothetical protein
MIEILSKEHEHQLLVNFLLLFLKCGSDKELEDTLIVATNLALAMGLDFPHKEGLSLEESISQVESALTPDFGPEPLWEDPSSPQAPFSPGPYP